MGHPIREAKIHTFERKSFAAKGAKWIAQLYPYRTYPVTFYGADEADVISQAEAMRTEAIEKHEKACARQETARRNKERAAAKK